MLQDLYRRDDYLEQIATAIIISSINTVKVHEIQLDENGKHSKRDGKIVSNVKLVGYSICWTILPDNSSCF